MTKIQFYAIELARNREGHNDQIRHNFKPKKRKAKNEVTSEDGFHSNLTQEVQNELQSILGGNHPLTKWIKNTGLFWNNRTSNSMVPIFVRVQCCPIFIRSCTNIANNCWRRCRVGNTHLPFRGVHSIVFIGLLVDWCDYGSKITI